MHHLADWVKNNKTIIIVVITLFAVYSTHSLLMHYTYQTHGFDLGVYTQIVYLYSQGQLAYSTIANITALANHFEPILILLAPIYKLLPTPNTLLIIQALFVSLSCIPIYLIGIKYLQNKNLAASLAAYYGTASGIIFAIHWDFHTSTLAVLPLALLLYSYESKKWKLYTLALLSSLLFKEDLPIYLVGWGTYQLIRKDYKVGICTIFLALIAFYLILFQITPRIDANQTEHFATYRISLSNLPLNNPPKLISYLVTQPQEYLPLLVSPPVKMDTTSILFAEYLYLPLASPLAYLTVLPYLFLRFTSQLDELWVLTMHYNANFQPFLIVSTIVVLHKIPNYKKITTHITIGILVLTIIKTSLFLVPLTVKQIASINRYSYIQPQLAKIPPEAAVSAQDPLVPHLSNRKKIFLFPDIQDAEYIILDDRLYQGFYYSEEKTLAQKESIKNDPYWSIVNTTDKLTIYKRTTQ